MKHDSIASAFALGSPVAGAAHQDTIHESAVKHVTGRAEYTDDLPELSGTLHGALGLSTIAHGTIVSIDLDPVRVAPGVVDVLTAKDVPGRNDVSPTGKHDDPIFASNEVMFHGQPIVAVIARTQEAARRAARLARIKYEALPHHLSTRSRPAMTAWTM
jgi:xanthine dehydrogenase large subunit